MISGIVNNLHCYTYGSQRFHNRRLVETWSRVFGWTKFLPSENNLKVICSHGKKTPKLYEKREYSSNLLKLLRGKFIKKHEFVAITFSTFLTTLKVFFSAKCFILRFRYRMPDPVGSGQFFSYQKAEKIFMVWDLNKSIKSIKLKDLFRCPVFWHENVQNVKSFRHTTQIPFILYSDNCKSLSDRSFLKIWWGYQHCYKCQRHCPWNEYKSSFHSSAIFFLACPEKCLYFNNIFKLAI